MVAFGLLGGISSSIIWTSSIATVGHWFMRNRGIAMGLATTAGGFGGVCYPLIFARLSRQIGFPWTMRAFALISGLSFFCSFVLMRTRLPRSSRSHVLFDWQGFKDIRFTITMAAIFILDWAVMVPPAYITTYAAARGFNTISPHILAILNSASIIGRGLPGLVADKVGRFNVMIICSMMSALSIFAFWLSSRSNAGLLIGFAVSYGFFSGSAFSLTPVCVAQLCNTEEFATRYGTAYSVVSLATLAGVPISGIILDSGTNDQYSALIIFCGVAYTVATILFFIARGLGYGWGLTGVF
jgi:MFS family permease